jgi:uncharacterized membrane protein YdjX (TVP38/TMEM64 family)
MAEIARSSIVPGAAAWRRLAVWGTVTVAVVVLARQVDAPALLRAALDAIAGLGPWAPPLFVLVYIAAAVLFLPSLILTLGAGAVFGVARAAVIVSISATLAATAAFLVSRYVARGWIARTLAHNARFRALDDAVAREGWKIVLLTRLSPVFPFALLNYVFGLTRVRLGHFVLASWIGMMPATITYLYLGSVAGELAVAGGRAHTPAEWALYGLGLAATIAVTVYVTRVARRALQARTHIP